eukprot:m.479065 g.479065  ORF g.479065 m.479065 type:complete len:92 (+) comp21311_c0_seq1:3122-3397(+)
MLALMHGVNVFEISIAVVLFSPRVGCLCRFCKCVDVAPSCQERREENKIVCVCVLVCWCAGVCCMKVRGFVCFEREALRFLPSEWEATPEV